MKTLKRIRCCLVLVLVLSIMTFLTQPISTIAVAQAATIKLSKKSLTLEIGKSYTLKMLGTSNKVTWYSSNKTIATVNKKGLVKAIKSGEATITAKVNMKKYYCKVIVKSPVNPYVTNAPFEAKEYSFDKVSIVYPKDWTSYTSEEDNGVNTSLHPADDETINNLSNITLVIRDMDTVAPEYSLLKEELTEYYTQDYFISESEPLDIVISDFIQSDFKVTLGTAFKTEYTISYQIENDEICYKKVIYDIWINEYLIELTISDSGETLTPDIYTVAEYILNSIQIKK